MPAALALAMLSCSLGAVIFGKLAVESPPHKLRTPLWRTVAGAIALGDAVAVVVLWYVALGVLHP